MNTSIKKSFLLLLFVLMLIFSLLGPVSVGALDSIIHVPLSLPIGWSDGSILDIWGSSASDVYAVGSSYTAQSPEVPLLYHKIGASWTATSLSLPTGLQGGNLTTVWGSSASNIYTAGYGCDASFACFPLVYQTNNGTNWTKSTLPLPTGKIEGYLRDVWGTGANNVYAVGRSNDPSYNSKPLIYRNSGGGWVESSPSLPAGWEEGDLGEIWGSSSSDLYVVGQMYNNDGNIMPLLYHNNGTGWTEMSLSLPAGFSSGQLSGVWGSSANNVYIAGIGSDANHDYRPFVYHYNGVGWTETSLPIPAGFVSVRAVSIWGSSTTDVYIVGDGPDANDHYMPIMYHYDGTVWTASKLTLPAEFGDGFLYSVWGSGADNIFMAGAGFGGGHENPLLYQKSTSSNVKLISGNAGVAGAAINYTGGSTSTDSNGNYQFTVLNGWSGTVTPSKSGYTFSPVSRTYSNVTTNQSAQNYTATAQIVYVKGNASGANNGSSWANAYISLQSALSAASSGGEIWVAAGTYKPTTGTDRTISFALKNGVALYGGFAGTETLRTQRDPVTNVTILSGDIGVAGNTTDNSYHVVYSESTNDTTVLDGFTITAGNANGSSPHNNGGGLYNKNSSLKLENMIFQGNTASVDGGGLYNISSNSTLLNITFRQNTATNSGGGIHNSQSDLIQQNITFDQNSAGRSGGGMANYYSHPTLTNVTFHNNSAATYGGGLAQSFSSPTLINVTFSGNSASASGGGAITNDDSHPVIVNSILYGNTGGEIRNFTGSSPQVTYSIVQGGYAGTGNLNLDPLLGSLENNGGFTQTMALGAGSPARDAGTNTNCPSTDQRGVSRPQGSHCDMGAYEAKGPIAISIAGTETDSFSLAPSESKRVSFPGVNNGPVKIMNSEALSLIAAERLIYRVNTIATSFTEMMGLPNSQLDHTYWLPWYNNVDLDTQLRFANVTDQTATMHVYVGGDEMTGSPFTLLPGASARKSFPGVNAGPVKIVSDQNIVAAERLIYKVNGVNTSFSEMMALPNNQLDTTYWLPWYNNVDLDTQLRFANVSGSAATVHVYIGGDEMQGSPFTLLAGESTRKSFAGVNAGPVQIVSNQNIVAAERLIYKVNNVATSFTEMMALPASQLDTTYWLPWYNNRELDTQLRFANTTNTPASVHIYIGGDEMQGSPFTLLAGESTRKSFANINNGPVQIVSDVPIVAAERLIYRVNNIATSFSEMMALPAIHLDTIFWLPWYNNVDLDTQLRFGIP